MVETCLILHEDLLELRLAQGVLVSRWMFSEPDLTIFGRYHFFCIESILAWISGDPKFSGMSPFQIPLCRNWVIKVLNVSQKAVTLHGVRPPLFVQARLQQYRRRPYFRKLLSVSGDFFLSTTACQ